MEGGRGMEMRKESCCKTFCFICCPQPIVSQISEDLKGEDRVVVDQLITEKQCEKLIELTSVSHMTWL